MGLNWEQGFRRIVIAISCGAALIGLVLALMEPKQAGLMIAFFGSLALLPWGLFYLTKWIVRGFVDAPPEPSDDSLDPPKSPEPTPRPSINTTADQAVASPNGDGRFKAAFWPTIRTDADAERCKQMGLGVALWVGATTGVLSILAILGQPMLGMSGLGLVDAALFLGLAYGIKRGNRIAAIAALCLYLVEVAVSWTTKAPRWGAMQVMFMLWFGSGVRGTTHLRRDLPILADLSLTKARLVKAAKVGLGLTALAIVVGLGLFLEWKMRSSLLGIPAYKWTTRALDRNELVAVDGSYRLGFADTKLDWRNNYDLAKEGHSLDHYLLGYPGLLLAVWNETGDITKFSDEQILVTKLGIGKDSKKKLASVIDVPQAIKGKFFVLNEPDEDGDDVVSVMGAFRASNQLVTLRFVPYPPTDGTPVKDDDILHDIKVVASSFQFKDARMGDQAHAMHR